MYKRQVGDLSKLVEVDDIVKTSTNIFSISSVFFENFVSTAGRSSITISCDDSLDIKLNIIGNNFFRSSSVFAAEIRATLGHFPFSSIPSSISSLRLRNIVSGIKDHKPKLEMCNSPDR